MMRGRYTKSRASGKPPRLIGFIGKTPNDHWPDDRLCALPLAEVTKPTIASVFPGVKRSVAQNHAPVSGNRPGTDTQLCVQHKEQKSAVGHR